VRAIKVPKHCVVDLMIGNLSNPSLNRWGVNIIWYRLWYADKIKQLYFQQDRIFEKLIYYYLYYGFTLSSHLFKNKFWFNNSFVSLAENIQHNLLYERVCELPEKLSGLTTQVTLRNKTKDFFCSKVWLLRYHRWIIVNFFTFQPIKTKIKNKKLTAKSFSTVSVESLSEDTVKNQQLLKRFKIFINHVISRKLFLYYKF